jgi:DNA-binding NarL/FixJ family response regulator
MHQPCNATMGRQAAGVSIRKTRMVVSTRADTPLGAPARDETMTANTLSALRPAPSSSCLSRSSQGERLPKAIVGMRVVVGAHEAIYRAGIAHVLQHSGADIVAGADTSGDLTRRLRAHRPDVAVVDMDLWSDVCETDRAEALREIRGIDPHLSLLILSELPTVEYALAADDRPDGFGYLLKASLNDVDELTASVRRVARGGVAIDPLILARLAGRRCRRDPFDSLTDREQQILALMAEGCSNRSIAFRLQVELTTVERHITGIFGKLDLQRNGADHRRVLAVLRYLSR